MKVRTLLSIHAEFGEETLDFQGDSDEVFKAITDFLNKVYPAFEMAKQLTFAVDVRKLAESLIEVVKIGEEGPILVSRREATADETMIMVLLGSYIGKRLGKLQKDSLTSEELSKATGKAHKTIMNQLPKAVESGLVEKLGKEYRISDYGIMEAQNVIANSKASASRANK